MRTVSPYRATFVAYELYIYIFEDRCIIGISSKRVQVGKDQEKAQSEKDSHSKNRGGKKSN